MRFLFAGERCFLGQEEWQRILLRPSRSQPKDLQQRRSLVDKNFASLAQVPDILYDLAYLDSLPPGQEKAKSQFRLTSRIQLLIRRYQAWEQEAQQVLPPIIEIPSQDPAAMLPYTLKFNNLAHMTLYLTHWATSLLLLECMDRISETSSSKEKRALVERICASLGTIGDASIGSFLVSYPVNIVWSFLDEDERSWLQGILEECAAKYGTISVVPDQLLVPRTSDSKAASRDASKCIESWQSTAGSDERNMQVQSITATREYNTLPTHSIS